MSDRVLVVDDEDVLRENLVRFLVRGGHDAEGVASAEEALEVLSSADIAVVITDLKMPGMGGEALLERTVAEYPDVLVIVITAYGSLESAVGALRKGAQDYLIKPLMLDEVRAKVERLIRERQLAHRVQRLRREIQGRDEADSLVAASSEMQDVMQLVGKAAAAPSNVLILGESGVGKELVARALHDMSPRADRDFIAVNLAAQPRDLVDATLFGHEKGAYTGANRRRDGVFRAARGGTVLLDEVGELPLDVQVKLLRVLENREVQPLGADRPEPVDFRLVAATNRSLQQRVDSGHFRPDLYFRLKVMEIIVPPLRDRPDDIPPLAQRFLRAHSEAMGRPTPQIRGDALAALRTHAWPGNVRELSNVVERAVLLADDTWVTLDDLPTEVSIGTKHQDTDDLKQAVSRFERRHVARVLERCGGDKALAAERLGVHVSTLYRHLVRLDLSD